MSPRQFTYDAKNLYDVTINFANFACQWICIVSFIDLGWLDRTCMAIVKSIMTTNFVVFQVTHDMTLLISMTTLCGTDNILLNILGSYPHLDSGIHIECEKFLVIFWKLLVVPRNIVPNMSNVMAKPLVNLDLLLLYYHELNPRSRLPIWLQVIKNLWFLFFFFFFFIFLTQIENLSSKTCGDVHDVHFACLGLPTRKWLISTANVTNQAPKFGISASPMDHRHLLLVPKTMATLHLSSLTWKWEMQ